MAEHFDVAVVGAGPAGSVTALELARGGARVALVDKATFPRDKACGDAVGPRGIALLEDLGLEIDTEGTRLGDMIVVGPARRKLRLPCFEGITYPGHGVAVPRRTLDGWLARKALDAGRAGRDRSRRARRSPDGAGDADPHVVELDGGRTLRADVVIGADGATSRVADSVGLVDSRRVLWGFAVRGLPRRDRGPTPHRAVGARSRSRLSRATAGCSPGRGAPMRDSGSARCRTDAPVGGPSDSSPPSWSIFVAWGSSPIPATDRARVGSEVG